MSDKPLVILKHGFNSNNGKESLDKLIPALEAAGLEVIDDDYGWNGLLMVKLFNARYARNLAKLIDAHKGRTIILLGHSNGCDIIWRTLQTTRAKAAIFINPALDNDKVPRLVDSFSVYFNPNDVAVWWANKIPYVVWGDMGRVGCTVNDLRKTQYNQLATLNMPTVVGELSHADIFNYPEWNAHIAREVWRLATAA